MMKPLRDHQCCLFLSLFLTRAHFLSGSNEGCIASQSPRNLTLSEGETAEITCSWKDLVNVRVNWLKNKTELKNMSRHKILPKENLSTLVISNVRSDDSGLYVCKVNQEIPLLRQCNGTGTQLTVNSKTKSNTMTDTKLNENAENSGLNLGATVSLAVVVGILVSCIPLIIWKRKKTGQQVIRGIPSDGEEHIDEHGEAAESNSNSSRGSTQWCQVPVYEAYFDHRRDGEDG